MSQSDDRDDEVRAALMKGGAFLLVICLIIALGTLLVVKVLGLDEGSDSNGPVSSATDPLPTTALPVPGESDTPAPSPSETETAAKGIQLTVSPVFVAPEERINLTGTYKGADALQLRVQRFEDGQWTDFPVDATVRAGTFQTWIMTSHTGDNKLRMKDPESGKVSNEVTVTVK